MDVPEIEVTQNSINHMTGLLTLKDLKSSTLYSVAIRDSAANEYFRGQLTSTSSGNIAHDTGIRNGILAGRNGVYCQIAENNSGALTNINVIILP
jgi:hypothetical protein